ncbi:MAG: hemolysin III family protein [Magnetospirillum sp.]|nr:hemolysin III family protein [Magnetospirillum sp.]
MISCHHPYSPAELWADGIIHALGVLFAIGAVIFLFSHMAGLSQGASLAVYGFGLAGMLGASAAYNMWRGPAREWLRRVDHAMIYVMIAGSYTPFVVLRLSGDAATLLGSVVWTGAAVGVLLKVFLPRRFERLSLALYLGLGWALVLGFEPLVDSLAGSTLAFLVAGGILYTLGVPLHLARRLRFHNAAWHACVLAAAICHFVAITGEFV